MGPLTKEADRQLELTEVDPALARPAEPAVPIDQIMRAVEGVRPYVKSHLGRYGFMDDVNDVLQDIRVAAWNGTVRGMYRELPEIGFPAWVQGIARHLCSDHIRRRMGKQDLPFLDETDFGFRCPADLSMSPVEDQVTNSGWAIQVLGIVRKNVPAETWNSAVASLSGDPKADTCPDADLAARKRWTAVTVVRQMAQTVRNALDIELETMVNESDVRLAAVRCLPTAVMCLIADRIVLTGVRGPARAEAVAAVAEEIGVSVRYIEVQIGTARRLVQVAMDVLRTGLGLPGSAVEEPRGQRPSVVRQQG